MRGEMRLHGGVVEKTVVAFLGGLDGCGEWEREWEDLEIRLNFLVRPIPSSCHSMSTLMFSRGTYALEK